MLINLLPTTLCNFRCAYCYIGKDALGDPRTLDLKKLPKILDTFSPIDHIDCYGGEVTLLPDDYMLDLLSICSTYVSKPITVISNGYKTPWWLKLPSVWPTFSWDYMCREKWREVYMNMKNFDRPFSLLMVATASLMKRDVGEIIHALNALPNLQSVEIKPYSPNQFNKFKITNKEFEEFIKKFIGAGLSATFVNEDSIVRLLDGEVREKILDDGFFIFPDGKIGSFEQDENDFEKFVRYEDKEYLSRAYKARNAKVKANPYCSKCEYLYGCISENFREVKNLDDSCDGFIDLIKWYEENHYDRA